MLGNMTMSFTPTYWAVLPLASVETISLGKPIGSARIAAVAMAVPPPPPSEITPSIFFLARPVARARPARLSTWRRPLRRGPSLRPARRNPLPPALATSSRVMSGLNLGGSSAPTSMTRTWCPRRLISSATKACSSPLVSIVPRTAMVAIKCGRNATRRPWPGGKADLRENRCAPGYAPIASSTSRACSSGFTAGQIFLIRPSGPIRKVTRWVPRYFRPMNDFSPQTP